jgi:hypothetical protein
MPIPGMTGGDSAPIVKYNAKARLWKVDDVSLNAINFIVDMDNAEAGWSRFVENSAPDFRMVPVSDLIAGKPFPEAPDVRDEDGKLLYRKGFRVHVKLGDKLAAGKASVREFASNSYVTKLGFDKLFDAWEAERGANIDKVPVVSCKGYEEVEGQFGSNFSPIFQITRWIDRPADLLPKSNGTAPTARAAAELVTDLGSADGFDDLDDDIPLA